MSTATRAGILVALGAGVATAAAEPAARSALPDARLEVSADVDLVLAPPWARFAGGGLRVSFLPTRHVWFDLLAVDVAKIWQFEPDRVAITWSYNGEPVPAYSRAEGLFLASAMLSPVTASLTLKGGGRGEASLYVLLGGGAAGTVDKTNLREPICRPELQDALSQLQCRVGKQVQPLIGVGTGVRVVLGDLLLRMEFTPLIFREEFVDEGELREEPRAWVRLGASIGGSFWFGEPRKQPAEADATGQ